MLWDLRYFALYLLCLQHSDRSGFDHSTLLAKEYLRQASCVLLNFRTFERSSNVTTDGELCRLEVTHEAFSTD
ncbi:hypothetical protein BJY01DRAFT_225200, partial [Aspergillus pseudoustus]